MMFFYMKEDVGCEEFLAAVYEAETEGSEGKVLNLKAKAMTVKKIVDNKEQNELKDLRQQIELLAMIIKSATMGNVTAKVAEGCPPQGRKKCQVVLLRKGFKDHPGRGRDL